MIKLSLTTKRCTYFLGFTVNKVLMHFKILVVFLPYIHIYTYAKLLTCIVSLRSSFTGVKQLLWFIWKHIYLYIYIYIYLSIYLSIYWSSYKKLALSASWTHGLIAQQLESLSGIQWLGVQVPVRSTFYSYIFIAHHFIFLGLNPFDPRVDREGWWFENSAS